jgi:hypothetical protein
MTLASCTIPSSIIKTLQNLPVAQKAGMITIVMAMAVPGMVEYGQTWQLSPLSMEQRWDTIDSTRRQ